MSWHWPGFRFEEADAARPYQPAVLAGPLDSIIAVRQVSPAARRIGDPDRVRAAHNGHRADQAARLLAGLRAAAGWRRDKRQPP